MLPGNRAADKLHWTMVLLTIFPLSGFLSHQTCTLENSHPLLAWASVAGTAIALMLQGILWHRVTGQGNPAKASRMHLQHNADMRH